MKNTILLLASLCALFGFTACDLDITPDTAITGPDAARLKYVRGMRAGVYNDMTSLASPAYTINDEYQSDLYVQTTNSSNRGGFFFRWEIYEDDQDIRGQWHGYYAMIANINYALNKCAETEVSSDAAREEIALYVAEMHFFRAYLFDQLALHFCKAYDPATAASTPGIPCPKSYAPGASLGRGTLAATYAAILEDLKVAEAGITTPGAADSPYLTVDAVTAFKARIALQMKDYGNAARYASSLYAKYPLAASKQALGEMWSADTSTETITQFLVTPTTLSLLGGTVSDFTAGKWEEANGDYLYAPSDVPTQTVADLFVEDDWRFGNYVAICRTQNYGTGLLMTKLLGNVSLRTTPTLLNYANMPKMFRVAEMYLIEAEARYRDNGDAATPLNALRRNRGLAPVTATGDALLQEIKNEWVSEFIGEGFRWACLLGGGVGCTRVKPDFLAADALAVGSSLSVRANDYRFTWPIPQIEIQNNTEMTEEVQNEGY